ncbi:hypothetical protein BC826DRAFT_1062944 [Russula brevipes]|nr:hypothetical protein BC826DRAFT_1062944 [Russula brevipes]
MGGEGDEVRRGRVEGLVIVILILPPWPCHASCWSLPAPRQRSTTGIWRRAQARCIGQCVVLRGVRRGGRGVRCRLGCCAAGACAPGRDEQVRRSGPVRGGHWVKSSKWRPPDDVNVSTPECYPHT